MSCNSMVSADWNPVLHHHICIPENLFIAVYYESIWVSAVPCRRRRDLHLNKRIRQYITQVNGECSIYCHFSWTSIDLCLQPRLATGRSGSPDNMFHSRRKPSMPIEIPRRRRPFVSPLTSPPIDQPKSPDLIFDMSPISPPFNHSIPLSTSNNLNDHTPFVYSVPTYIPHCRANTEIRSRQRVMPSLTAAPISVVHRNAWRTQTTHAESVNDNYNSHNGTLQSEMKDIPETQSTTRITGFIPIVEHQPSMTEHQPSKPVGRLSPPPRRASYSSSPWILPSNDNVEDDVAYSQMDPSLLDFKQHLLRRIENRASSRFRSWIL